MHFWLKRPLFLDSRFACMQRLLSVFKFIGIILHSVSITVGYFVSERTQVGDANKWG
jgi:hypothetical protein